MFLPAKPRRRPPGARAVALLLMAALLAGCGSTGKGHSAGVGIAAQAEKGSGHRFRLAHRDEQTVVAVLDDFSHAANGGSDARPAAR